MLGVQLPSRSRSESRDSAPSSARQARLGHGGRFRVGLILGIVVAVALPFGGWLAGRRISSPAELAARTKAPVPSDILVPVVRQVLSTDVVVRGTARYGTPTPITLATSPLRGGPGVLTSMPTTGMALGEGDVALTVSGRPVLVLAGAQPMYRDLAIGVVGDDVRQLEDALARLGYDPGAIDGTYDDATSSAVGAWFAAKGFAAQGPTLEQERVARAAAGESFQTNLEFVTARQTSSTVHGALETASNVQRLAHLVFDAASGNGPAAAALGQERVGAEADVARRIAELAAANERARVADLKLTTARNGTVTQPTAVELAALQAELTRATAVLASAVAEVTSAQAALEAVRLAGKNDVSIRQAALAVVLAEPVQDVAAIVAARNDLAAATATGAANSAAANATLLARQAAVTSAQADQATAQLRLDDARSTTPRPSRPLDIADLEVAAAESLAAVGTANADLANAQTLLAKLTNGASLASATGDLDAANIAVSRAHDEVQLADDRLILVYTRLAALVASTTLPPVGSVTGVQVPANEIVFVASLPARVDKLTLRTGDVATGPLLTLTSNQLIITAGLNAQDARAVKANTAAKITEPSLQINTTGTVTTVADTPGTNGADPQRFYLEVAPTDPPAALAGASVVVTLTVETTGGPVLAVPVSALSLRSDGASRVEVQQADATLREVVVQPGLAAQGLVEVTPLQGSLADGDLVVVGVISASAPQADSKTSTPPSTSIATQTT